jgi:competence protein ComEA
MPDDAPVQPVHPVQLPPRPGAASAASAIADRLRDLRGDPRVAVLLLVAAALAAGVYWFRSGIAAPADAGGGPGAETAAPGATDTTVPPGTTTTTAATGTVVVHVAGAVATPGVVTLPAGRRVVDAIDAAGGAAADADLDRLNLAAPLSDGQRIAVARRGQPAPPLDATAAGTTAEGGSENGGPVNLNTATQQQLESLPGIGPTLAQAIIDERERSGGFRAVEDLRRVHGIGDARFAQVEALVTV